MNLETLTLLFIGAATSVIIIYDIVIYIKGGAKATVSRQILKLSRNWLLIPFAFGMLMGHFFFPLCDKIECENVCKEKE